MKNIFYILFLFTGLPLNNQNVKTPDVPLFLISQDNRYGFIDSTGKIVIEPVFAYFTEFSEGLAAARINSNYGFIDSTGKFVIEPKYEYAEGFSNGVAVVYIDTIPAFLHRDGRELTLNNYMKVELFEKDRAYAMTYSKKKGVINTTETLIIDTLYDDISFKDNFAIADIDSKDSTGKYRRLIGCIDSEGKVLIPFGVYSDIDHFERGCAEVEINNSNKRYTGYVNKKGKLVISERDFTNSDALCDCINDSTFVVRFDKDDNYGLVNSKGKIIASEKNWRYIKPISENLCVISIDNFSNDFLIDAKGNIIDTNSYDLIYETDDRNDKYFILRKNGKEALKDFELNFIIPFQEYSLNEIKTGINYFSFRDVINGKNQFGISDFNGNVIVPPVDFTFDDPEFRSGLVTAFAQGDEMYINKEGKVVWKFHEDKPLHMNIDYRSTLNYSPDFFNENYFSSEYHPVKNGSDELVILSLIKNDTNIFNEYWHSEKFHGIHLKVSNNSGGTLILELPLLIKLQAKDLNGNWRYIENPDLYTLGHGRGRIETKKEFLKDVSWNFMFPEYEGDLNTVIRAEFKLRSIGEKNIDKTIYSNEVSCNINPEQLWRQRGWY